MAGAMAMTYVERINSELVIPKQFEFAAIDLFAGCGGLSLGFEACGKGQTLWRTITEILVENTDEMEP